MVKRQCPEGTSCKYIHENQHTGEFNHDNAPLPKQHDWGNGNGSSSLSSRSYSLSSGSSSTLGGSKRGASGLLNQPVPKRKPRPKKAPDQNAVIELLSSDDEVDFMTKGATKAVKRKKARKSFDGVVDLCESSEEEQEDVNGDEEYARRLAESLNPPPRPLPPRSRQPASPDSFVRPARNATRVVNQDAALARAIALSAAAVPPPLPPDPVKQAIDESNRAVVKEQNSEYEESLRQDKEKETARKEKEIKDKEEEELKLAIGMSEQSDKVAKEIVRNRRAAEVRAKGVPEEGEEGWESVDKKTVAVIKFKLPRRCSVGTVEKRFWISDLVESVTAYLSTLDVLNDVEDWSLVQPGPPPVVVEGDEWEGKSIEELGVVPRGMLVVRDMNA